MAELGFIFDYSKCVGCHACMVACYNENHTQPPISWRHVQPYNKLKVPLSGFINLSIACNHCQDAPCLKACPAHAYEVDLSTGAIIHYTERCIGCTYCTWACPFDAPQYNNKKGVIEKCNLCNDRLKVGLIPACTNACPTGALTFGEINIENNALAPGMSQKKTKPRVNFKNQNVLTSIPQIDYAVSGYEAEKSFQYNENVESKIDSLKEWPLVIFTLISSFLVGWILFLLSTSQRTNNKYLFVLLGIIGMTLSSLHLGKPFKAYRSILNIKTSWLSREILFFIVFFSTSMYVLFINPSIIFVLLAVISGLLLLIAVEFVYSITEKKYNTIIHSSNTVLTAIAFGFILSDFHSIAVGFIVLKAILYLVRYANRDIYFNNFTLNFVRFFIGIMMPLTSLLFLSNFKIVVVLPFILGEIIDRFEYYNDIYVETPSFLMSNHSTDKNSI